MTAALICQPSTTSKERSYENISGGVYTGPAVFSVGLYGSASDEPRAERRWATCLYKDPDDPDGWWTAQIMGLMGVASEGRTEDAALESLRGALSCALEAYAEEGGLPCRQEPYEIPQGGKIVHLTL